MIHIVLPYPASRWWQLSLAKRLAALYPDQVKVTGLRTSISGRPLWRSRLYDMWRRLDARVFANDKEALGKRGFEESGVAPSDVQSACSTVYSSDSELVDALNIQSPNVLMWLVPGKPPESLLKLPIANLWWLSSTGNVGLGFHELVESAPLVQCELLASSGSAEAKHEPIGRVFAKTDNLSLSRTLRRLRALEESLVVSKLNESSLPASERAMLPPEEHRCSSQHGTPSLIQFVMGLSRLYGRYFLSVFTRRRYRDQWQLMYSRNCDGSDDFNNWSRLAPDNENFWADPFVAHHAGQSAIFFEEWDASVSKGRIVASEIEPGGGIKSPAVVIEQDYHLSYPYLFQYDDSLYLVPESADANRIEAYRCVDFPYGWERHAVLLNDIRAFDATLFEHDSRWWMFAAVQHNGNTTCDELHLFYAEQPFGQWQSHPSNPISLDIRSARPGGAVFERDGQLFRPAQDCSECYGYALSIQRITHLDEHRYREETAFKILPDWSDEIRGIHTFNNADEISLRDCIVRRRK